MIIIEFCGTPGCGKSTLCTLVENNLKMQGHKAQNLQLNKKSIKKNLFKKFLKACNYLRYLTFSGNIKLRNELFRYVKRYPKKDSLKWLFRLLEINYKIDLAKRSGLEYALFDEGTIQFLTSLSNATPLPKELVQSVGRNIYKDIEPIVFFCSVDLCTNINRLKMRNRKNDRFLFESDEQIIEKLFFKNKSIQQVIKDIGVNNVVNIEMSNSTTALEKCMEKI